MLYAVEPVVDYPVRVHELFKDEGDPRCPEYLGVQMVPLYPAPDYLDELLFLDLPDVVKDDAFDGRVSDVRQPYRFASNF